MKKYRNNDNNHRKNLLSERIDIIKIFISRLSEENQKLLETEIKILDSTHDLKEKENAIDILMRGYMHFLNPPLIEKPKIEKREKKYIVNEIYIYDQASKVIIGKNNKFNKFTSIRRLNPEPLTIPLDSVDRLILKSMGLRFINENR
jgi:hypothetical protein